MQPRLLVSRWIHRLKLMLLLRLMPLRSLKLLRMWMLLRRAAHLAAAKDGMRSLGKGRGTVTVDEASQPAGRERVRDDPAGALLVRQATTRARAQLAHDPRGAIAAVGGFEIAAMAGFFIEAHRLGLTVVLDGMIATASALIAEVLEPGTTASLIAAHRSAEPAHGAMLARLGLAPLLDGWAMRLGEGTGALLALPLLDAAAAILTGMDTLDDLGIGPTEAPDAPG